MFKKTVSFQKNLRNINPLASASNKNSTNDYENNRNYDYY